MARATATTPTTTRHRQHHHNRHQASGERGQPSQPPRGLGLVHRWPECTDAGDGDAGGVEDPVWPLVRSPLPSPFSLLGISRALLRLRRSLRVYSLSPSTIGAHQGYILSPLLRLVPTA
eukprot:6934734-Pyramimonas_sp.AAC.1